MVGSSTAKGRLSEPEQVLWSRFFIRRGLKFRDERDRVESVADQSHTENTAGTEYLKALQIESLHVCVCVCACAGNIQYIVCVCVYGLS